MLGDEKKRADYDQFGKSPLKQADSGMKGQGLISARPLILADSEMFFPTSSEQTEGMDNLPEKALICSWLLNSLWKMHSQALHVLLPLQEKPRAGYAMEQALSPIKHVIDAREAESFRHQKVFFRMSQSCTSCGGSGRKITKTCKACNGRGKHFRQRR